MSALLGALAAGLLIFLLHRLGRRRRRRAWALGLLIAALIYVVFAQRGGASDWLAVELGGVTLFGAVAYLGVRFRPVLLALGWAAHAGWDYLLPHRNLAFVPGGYADLCLVFDLVVASYLFFDIASDSG